ncbi:C40 family peptidase [Roseivirga misakiensis]|uniref:C40 family peptidase n=1 Tax=Roseivirga misakiensis TaxID=1563681 RepID=UPI000B491DC3|nr:TIGR02594 family protein [Roseivirga misakiensis]
MSKLLALAFNELGVSEIQGPEHEERILTYAHESGFESINDDETPWCSIFINYCCVKLNLEHTGKANARSWMHVGKKTKNPKPGDIVVFWRESIQSWKGHVAIFTGFSADGTQVFCLGGNQGNRVSIAAYSADKVLGFRRLEKQTSNALPAPVLRKGSRGKEVEKLQIILNQLGYNCGDPDGAFGQMTHDALILFQSNNRLAIDGVYGNGSKDMIESLMQS